MDDQLFAKRMQNLKSSYDEMPVVNNRDQILQTVKKEEKQISRKKIFHFPYVASFIGVGIITGILLMQFFAQDSIQQNADSSDKVGDHSVPIEEAINNTFVELEGFYNKKQDDLKEMLGVRKDSSILFAAHIPSLLDTERERALKNSYTEKELTEVRKKYEEIIMNALTPPLELIEQLGHAKDTERDIKTVALIEAYDEYLFSYRDLINIDYKDELSAFIQTKSIDRAILDLNHPYESSLPGALHAFATGIRQNGYQFTEDNGFIAINKDIPLLYEKLDGKANEEYLKYISLHEKQLFNQKGELTMSWQGLAELLVQYEKTYIQINNNWIRETMKHDLKSLFALVMLGHSSKPLFDEKNQLKEEVKGAYRWVIENHPNTTTAATLRVEYESLKAVGFVKPADFDERPVVLPDFVFIEKRPITVEKITEQILPLSDDLLSIYKQFKAKQDDSLLSGYGPFDVMRLYFHAEVEQDYETLYALLNNRYELPPKDMFISDMSSSEGSLGDILKDYDFATLYHKENDPALIMGVELHFKDSAVTKVFGMTMEKGIWKVNFMPFQ